MSWEESALIRLHISKLHWESSFGHRSKENKLRLQCMWWSISIIFSALEWSLWFPACWLVSYSTNSLSPSIYSCWHSRLSCDAYSVSLHMKSYNGLSQLQAGRITSLTFPCIFRSAFLKQVRWVNKPGVVLLMYKGKSSNYKSSKKNAVLSSTRTPFYIIKIFRKRQKCVFHTHFSSGWPQLSALEKLRPLTHRYF